MENSKFEIISGGEELLPQIETLWLKLKDFHIENFPIWSESLRDGKFSDRVEGLVESSRNGALLVELAQEQSTIIAFCISVIDKDGTGELASLFVEENFRKQNIAQRLVRSSLQWLKEHKAAPIFVDVMAGNEVALEIYQKAGFAQRVHRLHWVD